MANSGWTADPDSIQVPPDATDSDPRIYIGPDDPYAISFDQLASIVFYWAIDRGFMLSVEAVPGQPSGEFHLWSFDDDELKQIIDIVHDDSGPEDQSSLKVGQDDSLYEVSLKARQQIFIEASGEPDPDSGPTVYLGGFGDPDYDGTFPPDVNIYGRSMHRGITSRVTSTVNSAAIGTTETVIATLPSTTYRAERVYEMKITGEWNISIATNLPVFKIRKTNAAGQILGEWGRVVGNGTNLNAHALCLQNRFFWVDGTADVTATLVLTLVVNAGTATMQAAAGVCRKVEIFDVGNELDYTDIEDEPQLV